jgi:gamma-glutamyltranspeptidase/glutathione hydrolase
VLSNVLDYPMHAGSAMGAPRMHHQDLPDQTALEQDGFDVSLQQALEKRGHRLTSVAVPRSGWCAC